MTARKSAVLYLCFLNLMAGVTGTLVWCQVFGLPSLGDPVDWGAVLGFAVGVEVVGLVVLLLLFNDMNYDKRLLESYRSEIQKDFLELRKQQHTVHELRIRLNRIDTLTYIAAANLRAELHIQHKRPDQNFNSDVIEHILKVFEQHIQTECNHDEQE